jgi:hypothetical protein
MKGNDMLGLEQRFQVKDGPRNLSFVGWKLGEADSRTTGEEARWTELSLYKTTTGRYVLQKVGCSDVFHNETCNPKRGRRYDNLDLAADLNDVDPELALEEVYVLCGECNPSYDDQPVWVERDIFAASTFGSVEELLEALYRPDTKKSSRFLSRVARSLLEQATEKDDEINRVMNAPIDVT